MRRGEERRGRANRITVIFNFATISLKTTIVKDHRGIYSRLLHKTQKDNDQYTLLRCKNDK